MMSYLLNKCPCTPKRKVCKGNGNKKTKRWRHQAPPSFLHLSEEYQRFEISIEDFNKRVEEIAARPKNILVFSHFCSNLHKKIEWSMVIQKSMQTFYLTC